MENVPSRLCLSRLFVLFAVSVTLTLGFAAVAGAQQDEDQFDCESFGSQESAQAELDADPSDPNNLDPDGNGQACDDFDFGVGSNQQEQPEDQDAAQSDGSCSNPREVASVGPTADNTKTPFETTGPTFRVTYDVTFTTDDDFRLAEIDIEDRFGLVDFVNLDEDANDSFVVTEGAGSYDLVVNIDPPNGADYTVTVEDCGGGSPGGQTGDDQTGDDGQGNADKQYEGKVIKVTIVKGLPKTGGPSPLLIPWALALVGAGIMVLRRS